MAYFIVNTVRTAKFSRIKKFTTGRGHHKKDKIFLIWINFASLEIRGLMQ